MGRQLTVAKHQPKPLLDDLGRKRSGPACVGRGEDQRAGNGRMPTVQFEREATAPREPSDVRPSQTERLDERCEAVGPIGEAKLLRWIR